MWIAVLLIHGRINAATLMHHGVGPLLYMAALTQACRVSSKTAHPPVSLSNYQDIIWNKLYFDHISTIFRTNCPCVLTESGKGHVFADEEPTGKKKRKICIHYRKQRQCKRLTGGLTTTMVRYHYGINEVTTSLNEKNPEQLRVPSEP
jgi:hypothetical protein